MVLPAFAGSLATALTWLLLEWIARTVVSASTQSAGSASGRYLGALFVAGAGSGLAGGMVAGLMSTTAWSRIQSGLGSALLTAFGALMARRWFGSPVMGDSAMLWIVPLALLSMAGAASTLWLERDRVP